MAKKKVEKKMPATSEAKDVRRVRLDLGPDDAERMERAAKRRGLTMAAYARQAVLSAVRADLGED